MVVNGPESILEDLKRVLQNRSGKALRMRLIAASVECQALDGLTVLELRRLVDEAMTREEEE